MAMTQRQLKAKASALFTFFEFEKFENKLSYSRKINLVLEFCDYINQKSDWEILEMLESDCSEDAKKFRNLINDGADVWLEGLIKTVCLGGY